MISYAGHDLHFHDADLLARARAYLDPADAWAWVARGLPRGLRHLGWRPPREERVRPGVLAWPASSASSWAYLHVLASRETMEAIVRDVVAVDNGPLDLILDDGTRSLTAEMYLLPPRPLYDVEGAGGTFLVTLVDDRWRWWQVAADLALDAGTTTWAEWFALVADALDVTITVDDVPAAYLAPPADLAARHRALPPLLDAAAWSVGMRCCRDPDGTVAVRGATTSRAREAANLLLTPRLVGGALFAG